MAESRSVLRGYSWVTVCPRGLVARLGGVRALASSGAFCRVEELADGGVWVQATQEFSGYDEVAVRRVFGAVAPVLPAGVPWSSPVDDRHVRLEWQDAAWYRSGGLAARSATASGDSAPRQVVGAGRLPGRVVERGGGYEIGFDRVVPVGVEGLWLVLTTPAAMLLWLGWQVGDEAEARPVCEMQPRVGGPVDPAVRLSQR